MSAWDCHLLTSSPRYEKWREILGSDEAPIKSPALRMADFGDEEKDVEVYELELSKLSADQRSRLIDFIVERFGEKRETVERELDSVGFPIRSADVVVAFDHRFFT